ncbi:MAG: DUF1080 domain-containing protein [Chitinophagaceae bacterium]|nr:MAG: DUF1080 domain-containing protein [Chitinophagaceae bacterium]
MQLSIFKKAGMLTTALAIGFTISGIAQQNLNTLTKREKREGWQSLFNGDNLEGWHTYHKKDVDPCWSVNDGAIELNHSKGKGGGDLVTNGEYQNFELDLDWKIAKGGNSGIIFDINEAPQYGATYITGPEMQVLDNVNADDNKKASHLAGSLYDLIPCNPATVHPYGEWNHVRIRLDNGHLTLWMNGKKVVETIMWDAKWNQMVANSKFKRWPEFATFHKGHVALQDHGDTVWYRNIRIKEL